MTLNVSVSGHLTLKQQVSVLSMSPRERKQLNKEMVREVKKNSRRRLREQRDLDGSPWAQRKGRSRKKMLRRLSKHMFEYATATEGVVRFRGNVGRVAKEHQDGVATKMTAQKAAKRYGKPNYDEPATRRQAKQLKQAGFKRPRKGGGGYSNATLRWITENMTSGQAGLVLRELEGTASKRSWDIELPSRSFLGATEDERREQVQTIFERTRQKMNAAKR